MNILLTSVGRRSYMINYFKEAFSGIGQVHAANSTKTYALQIADRYLVTPLIYDISYIQFLYDYCIESNIKVIISLFDVDLPILAKNKKKFKDAGIDVIISNYEFTLICNDKWLSYQFFNDCNFNSPVTYLTLENVETALSSKEVQFPLIVKPRWGMGSIGIFEADNWSELIVFYNKAKKCISESYLKYESQIDIDKCVIIQEKLLGEEYGLDIFNDLNGHMLTSVQKKKLAIRAGETDIAEIIHIDDFYELSKRLSLKTMHIANLDVDCFFVNQKFYILEMNCRFGGQYPFSHLSGVNFPKVIVQMLLGEKIDKELLKSEIGIIGIKDLVPIKLK